MALIWLACQAGGLQAHCRGVSKARCLTVWCRAVIKGKVKGLKAPRGLTLLLLWFFKDYIWNLNTDICIYTHIHMCICILFCVSRVIFFFALKNSILLQMESARKAWENSPNVREKGSPVTSTAPPIASGVSSNASGPNTSYSSFASASVPQIPVASVTPTTSLSGSCSLYLPPEVL